jgi:hypothetical protein
MRSWVLRFRHAPRSQASFAPTSITDSWAGASASTASTRIGLKQEVRIASLGTERLRDASRGFELYYNLEISRCLHFTAYIQLVQNANKDDDFAVIPGGRLVLDL